MPIYEYRPSQGNSCEVCRDGFELLQKSNELAITTCPECQAPVKRVISASYVGRSDATLSSDNLEKHGFTQYKKSSKGIYHKTAGKGPKTIRNE